MRERSEARFPSTLFQIEGIEFTAVHPNAGRALGAYRGYQLELWNNGKTFSIRARKNLMDWREEEVLSGAGGLKSRVRKVKEHVDSFINRAV